MQLRRRGSGDEATGGQPRFVRAAPCSRRPRRFRVANLRPHVTREGGLSATPRHEQGGFILRFQRAPTGFPLNFLYSCFIGQGHVTSRGGLSEDKPSLLVRVRRREKPVLPTRIRGAPHVTSRGGLSARVSSLPLPWPVLARCSVSPSSIKSLPYVIRRAFRVAAQLYYFISLK